MAAERLGVDLGGSKIEAVLLAADGTVLVRKRCPTPAGDYRGTLAAVAALVAVVRAGHAGGAAAPVGVGAPGSCRPDGLMHNCNSTCLNGQPLAADLAAVLGCPVRVANDANCMALSEATDGAAAGARTVFGVILGTGVGGGLVVAGELLQGATGLAGEWGHNSLAGVDDLPGAPLRCWCGRSNCVETWLSGPGLLAQYQRRVGPGAAAHADAQALVVAALSGRDGAATATLARWEQALGRALAAVVNLLDPHVVVLAGGLSQVPGLCQRLPALVQPWVFAQIPAATRWCTARHGDSSGVRGAAWLWPLP